MLVVPGPPPQAVLNQRWVWQVLIVLLSLTFMLGIASVDVSGALLSALMLWFAVIIIRDGMYEISRYALVFAILCFLNLIFELLPLLAEINGRVRSTVQGHTITGKNGQEEYVYTVSTERTPLFDWNQGFIYNAQTMEMFVAPITYALGLYLSVTAHQEIQMATAGNPAFDNEVAVAMAGAPGVFGGAPLAPAALGEAGSPQRRARERGFVQHFQGRSYKLDAEDALPAGAGQVEQATVARPEIGPEAVLRSGDGASPPCPEGPQPQNTSSAESQSG